MYSPDKQGDYTPKSGVQNFLVQWLTDALATPNSEVTKVSQPAEEYVLLLEVMMVDRPGCPRPPTFSWNSSIILHILKRDPALRDLEHVQVDGPGTVYLFFYDKQGHKGLKMRPQKTSRHTSLRRSRSGSPTLPTSWPHPCLWQRDGIGPQQLWAGIIPNPRQTSWITQHHMDCWESLTPHHSWWVVHHQTQCGLAKWMMVSAPL